MCLFRSLRPGLRTSGGREFWDLRDGVSWLLWLHTLSFLSLFFWNSLFFALQGIPCFLSVFRFFSRDFRGSVGIKILVFLVVFLAIFKKTRKGRTGMCRGRRRGGRNFISSFVVLSESGPFFHTANQRKTEGVESSEEGKTHHQTPPQEPFWTPPPPPVIRFPPFFVHALSYSLEGRDTDQTNPTFWALQNQFWRVPSIVRFPPQKSHDTFCPLPPPCAIPKQNQPSLPQTCTLVKGAPWSTAWVLFRKKCRPSICQVFWSCLLLASWNVFARQMQSPEQAHKKLQLRCPGAPLGLGHRWPSIG